MLKVLNIVGARPNYMKVAPIHNAMLASGKIEPVLVHTGQHYDARMSDVFFSDLGLPEPDVFLGVGSGSHAEQTAKIMVGFEKVILEEKPDAVLVVGDVNSTIACAMVAVKMGIKVVHVEAGLRSFDRSMPEEINRLMTDVICDYLYVSEESGLENLRHEGVAESKIIHVGNCMIDSLITNLPKARERKIIQELNLIHDEFILSTIHRPANVDSEDKSGIIVDTFLELAQKIKIVLPLHPRSRKNLMNFGLFDKLSANANIIMIEPAGYLDFVSLMYHSKLLLTDSGGIQEETTYLGKPCLTLRESTERPSTVIEGTNIMIPQLDKQIIIGHVNDILNGTVKQGRIPKFWDGHAAERIVEHLAEVLK